MGYIREPKGVDFVVEPHVVTDEDRRIMTEIITAYRTTGKITRAPRLKIKARRTAKKAKK
jgi:hypothetical protein